jgi:signal peptidase I
MFHETGAKLAAVAVVAAVAVAVAAGLVFRPHLMRVPSEAMAPEVGVNQYIVVVETVGQLQRGDIVVMRSRDSGRDHLWRVVVLPGETFDIVDGRVRIAGKALDEPYVTADRRSHETIGPFTMAPGQYYLLGDNRANAADSRYGGPVSRDRIWGRRIW